MIRDVLGLSIRITLLVAAPVTGMAIFLGRENPGRPARRIESAAPYQVLNKTLTGDEARLLDVEKGRLEVLPLPAGLLLDKASLSPWEDRGRRQVVGIGWHLSVDGPERNTTDLGMIRMASPGGEVLDKVDLGNYASPTGAPCWFPGTLARVLYAGFDGRIYRLDFETAGAGGDVAAVPEIQPRALTWKAPVPEEGDPKVIDLSWPSDDRMGGKLIASLCFRGRGPGRGLDWQVWWLELDRGGTSIVAAGRLLRLGAVGRGDACRLPTLIRDAGGALTLAYLARQPRQPGYELRVAPVHFDPGSGFPQARESGARVLARGCSLVTPAASPDSRWVTVVRADGPSAKVERLPLGGVEALVTGLP